MKPSLWRLIPKKKKLMALDITTFETILPSRFISFTIPHPSLPTHLLRVAVLDSPVHHFPSQPLVAALFVPLNRESDWVFSTESGQLQLLLSSPGISRLILIGNNPSINSPDALLNYSNRIVNTQYVKSLQTSLKPLLRALSLQISVKDRGFDVPILEYDDNVLCSVVLERVVGVFVGEMLVEDVEVEKESELHDCEHNCGKREFRRRLRFKRMPNLVQTEVRIVPEMGLGLDVVNVNIGEGLQFRLETSVLVHSYLVPMVAGVSLIASYIEDLIQKGANPKALCLGVGGGALLSFLTTQLGFEVFGVEMDVEVLRVAKKYFGLDDCGIRVRTGDAIEYMEKLAGGRNVAGEDCCLNRMDGFDTKFEVLMVDLDSCDARSGISAPPLEFVRKHILLAARSVLCDYGILVINVIPPSKSFYETLIYNFREVFHEVYEIDAGNGENFVLIAKVSAVLSSSVTDSENSFLKKLSAAITGKYLDCIRRI